MKKNTTRNRRQAYSIGLRGSPAFTFLFKLGSVIGGGRLPIRVPPVFISVCAEKKRKYVTPLEPQSRLGDKPLEIRAVYPQNGTAVLKGLSIMRHPDEILYSCVRSRPKRAIALIETDFQRNRVNRPARHGGQGVLICCLT